jgi:hypothetical protein
LFHFIRRFRWDGCCFTGRSACHSYKKRI